MNPTKIQHTLEGHYTSQVAEFSREMIRQLIDHEHIGDWNQFRPGPHKLAGEIAIAQSNLLKAMDSGDADAVKRHSAHLANYAMKAYQIFGKS
jgi:hypothetical protein